MKCRNYGGNRRISSCIFTNYSCIYIIICDITFEEYKRPNRRVHRFSRKRRGTRHRRRFSDLNGIGSKLASFRRRSKGKLDGWSKDKWLVRTGTAALSAILLLAMCLGLMIFVQLNTQRQYSNAAYRMREQVYEGLHNMTELFARVDDPEVDVQNKLIPELKAEYTGVSAVNAALATNFGESQAVLSDEQTAAFENAFGEYSSAYRQGLATGLAQADMSACIEVVAQMVYEHYTPKVEPTEPVVIIDGSSGEIAVQ